MSAFSKSNLNELFNFLNKKPNRHEFTGIKIDVIDEEIEGRNKIKYLGTTMMGISD